MFLRFKGGRGIAVGLGVLLMIAPYTAIVGLPAFIVVTLKSRYISMGSIIGAMAVLAAFPVFAAFGLPNWMGVHSWTYIYFAVVATLIVVFQHRDNIKRLLKGEERRLGETTRVLTEAEAGRSHE